MTSYARTRDLDTVDRHLQGHGFEALPRPALAEGLAGERNP
jgi:hypothetical protein